MTHFYLLIILPVSFDYGIVIGGGLRVSLSLGRLYPGAVLAQPVSLSALVLRLYELW